MRVRTIFSICSSLFVTATFFPAQSHGIVLHDLAMPVSLSLNGDQQVMPTSTGSLGVPDAYVGRWSSYASAVPINPNFVLISRHQGGGIGTTVTIDGTAYSVVKKIDHPSADLAIALIFTPNGGPASLPDWATVHNTSLHGPDWGREMVIGGFGKTTGQTLVAGAGVPYAYEWGGNTSSLNWGTNRIDRVLFRIPQSSYNSSGLQAEFTHPDDGPATAHEAIGATGDSGGGWFLSDAAGNWTVAGLTVQVQTAGKAIFRDPNTGLPAPDRMYAVRLSQYNNWINQTIAAHEPRRGDINLDGKIDEQDIAVVQQNLGMQSAGWFDGDVVGDGRVTLYDAYTLFKNYEGVIPQIGDANADGVVDDLDLALVQENLGQSGLRWAGGDFDHDRRVTLYDAYMLFQNYQSSVGQTSAPSTAIPEPSSLIVMMGAGLVLLGIRPRRASVTVG